MAKSFDTEAVRAAAKDRWNDILCAVGRIPASVLDGRQHPCPKCGGKDRFRLIDRSAGAVFCNQCFSTKNGDGFAALTWALNCKFGEAVKLVGEHVGVKPGNGYVSLNPAKNLEFLPWNKVLAMLWCRRKRPIRPEAIQAVGGRLATYYGNRSVIAIPIWGAMLDKASPVGWVVYDVHGRPLPRFIDRKVEWVPAGKPKITFGSQPGVIGPVQSLPSARKIWKVEGVSDMLGILSLPDLPDGTVPITNANGAKERPAQWMVDLFAGKDGVVIHDADRPGEDGAAGWRDRDDTYRPGWAAMIATKASDCRHARLPYEIVSDHGKDIRDFLNEGKSFVDLEALAVAADKATPNDSSPRAIEAADDPHRLARINLALFRQKASGELRHWQRAWYKWELNRGCYQRMEERDLKARINASIKEEFDRISIENQLAGRPEDECISRKVSPSLVEAVLQATHSKVLLSDKVELNSWLEGDSRSKPRYIAMRNGILDLDALLSGQADFMRPFSPNWFSTVCLPYEYVSGAQCPTWMKFLDRMLEGDHERIAIAQEWFGYCLSNSTDMQKFLFLEGEGSNGKNVFMSALEGMVGMDNCSHINLEHFGQPYMLTETVGKLLNIATECDEIDSVAEGYLKAVTDGSRMSFNRKHKDPIEAGCTARLVFSANTRPKFRDKSYALWRRMILMPWRVQIPEHEKIYGMDKIQFWMDSGEMPGIFRWAVAGLARLNQNRRFSTSKICEFALDDYRDEVNPAKMFLKERFVACSNPSSPYSLDCKSVYDEYVQWCEDCGYRAMSDRSFGKEVSRHFRGLVERERKRMVDSDGHRRYLYTNLRRAVDIDHDEAKQNGETYVLF